MFFHRWFSGVAIGLVLTAGVPLAAKPVFYASFDNSPDAEFGAVPEAEVHNGPARFDDGLRGQALLAGDDQVYLSFDTANLPGREGTIEFWIKPLGWDAMSTLTFHVWVETDPDPAGNWFVFYKYYADQSIRFLREPGRSLVERKVFPWPSDWIHLAVTWSAEAETMYWNGKPSGARRPVDPAAVYAGRLKIGDRGWNGDMPRVGEKTLLDEFYIYDRALEPEEIMWAYENGRTRTPGSDVPAQLVPMKVRAVILPSQGRLLADVRHRLDGQSLGGLTGTAEVQGPIPLAPVPLRIGSGRAAAELSFDQLEPGDYTLLARVHGGNGELVHTAQDKFSVAANEWLGNRIGISETPPPPFTNLEARQDGFSCLLRRYDLSASGLPAGIESAGAELLAAPMALQASAAGQPVIWEYGPTRLNESSAVQASYSGTWRGRTGAGFEEPARLVLEWTAQAEYDGMIQYELQLTPAAEGVVLDTLELRFPIRQAMLIQSGPKAGAIPAGTGPVFKAPLADWWWVGNEERGLAAFYESDAAWDRIDRPDGFRVERRADAVAVVWSFAGSAFRLQQPWTFTFGMTATPVKPCADRSGRPLRVMYNNPWLMDTPRDYRYSDAGLAAMIANEGIRNTLWSHFSVLWLGGEWTTYALDWRRRPQAVQLLHEALARLRANGQFPLQYFLPREVPENLPEWRYWGAEWAGNRKISWTQHVWDSTTCTPSWVDFIVWYMVNNMRKYGFSGHYVDNATPAAISNPFVSGAGYLRDGVWRDTRPWFAMREIFKRLYTAVRQEGATRREPTMIMAHCSGTLPVAYLGFMDNRLDGEQFRHAFLFKAKATKQTPNVIDIIPLDIWRSQFAPTGIGTHCRLLAYAPIRTKELAALLLLHDAGAWFSASSTNAAETEAVHAMWRIQDEFGVQHAEFLPYWSNTALVSSQTERLKVTAYRHPEGGTLLIVANLDDSAQDAVFQIDWGALKSPGPLQIEDARTGAPLPTTGQELRLRVAAHDYRALRVH